MCTACCAVVCPPSPLFYFPCSSLIFFFVCEIDSTTAPAPYLDGYVQLWNACVFEPRCSEGELRSRRKRTCGSGGGATVSAPCFSHVIVPVCACVCLCVPVSVCVAGWLAGSVLPLLSLLFLLSLSYFSLSLYLDMALCACFNPHAMT